MFKKILIANRGEIACRIMQTAQNMGVECVAVASDIDAHACHAQMADHREVIGGASPSESYLVMDKILSAAQKNGVEAIHPAYGFLSENAQFARKCEEAGLIFIGPSSEVIGKMGLKDTAREIMKKAGVPVVPGVEGKDLAKKAEKIGFPLLVKAAAGGGGKGMRKVEEEGELEDAIAACSREARSAFGNEDVFVEKYIETPRHVEVQIFGDRSGNVVHLFERDCSLQRRHQKVVEEAPAPGLPEALRKKILEAAVTAGESIGYVNAGTVEFIIDAGKKLTSETPFYFMEMNTRLQVEHPVTEMITGFDLVEWQFLIASGEPLPKAQKDIKAQGHSFEIRLYAEDPARDFTPQTGRIDRLCFPHGNARCDTGIRVGDEITAYYDPMLAKICTWGADRAGALDKMREALAGLALLPVTTNHAFLSRIFDHEDFAAGKLDTHFIPRHHARLVSRDLPDDPLPLIAGLAALRLFTPGQLTGSANWRLNSDYKAGFQMGYHGQDVRFQVAGNEDSYDITYGEHKCRVRYASLAFPDLRFELGGRKVDLRIWQGSGKVQIIHEGHPYIFDQVPAGLKSAAGEGEDYLIAPMPGRITEILMRSGAKVSKGDVILRMEAMKIETSLRAGKDGMVSDLVAEINEIVEDGAVLARIEEESS